MRPVPERLAAKAASERTYDTGKSCRNGHLSARWTRSGNCIACDREKAIRFLRNGGSPEHPNRIAARSAGERHYSGQPCPEGHDKRFVANGHCAQCSIKRATKWKNERPGYEAAYKRDYRKRNPHKQSEVDKRYREKHPEKVRAKLDDWRKSNPERVRLLGRVSSANRRARVAENGGTFTAADIEALHTQQNGRCAVCPCNEGLQVDHILPIVLGGSSDPTNLQLLCWPCNRAKADKHPDVWRAELRLRSPQL